jgi:hypothetical protein
MLNEIPVHGNPEKSVFGTLGTTIGTDEGKIYLKDSDDTKNVGWQEVLPPPSPTPTPTITPTKTMIVTRTPTPGVVTPTPSTTIGATPTPTPTPAFGDVIQYEVASNGVGGYVERVDGSYPFGNISRSTGSMHLRATLLSGYAFLGWTHPEGVAITSQYSLNITASMVYPQSSFKIVANFGEYLPTYQIDCQCNDNGEYQFTYKNLLGFLSIASGQNYGGGAIVTGAACGNSVVQLIKGKRAYTVLSISC